MRYLSLNVRTARVVHGYDADHREIAETVAEEAFTRKLILLDRIQSVSERYLLVSAAFGRQMYWEYQGGFAALEARLAAAGLLVGAEATAA